MTQSPIPEGEYAEVGAGLRMHYHSVGEGEAILFLHGSGPGASGWSNFSANAQVFAEKGYRCILPDSLGYGLSSKPTEGLYTLEFMGGAALKLMDHLGILRFTIVGNSQGGAQAIHLALKHPSRVEKLVLMAPGGLESRERYMEMPGIRSMMRCIYGPEGITREGMHKLFSKQVVDPSIIPPELIDKRYEVAMTQPRHVFESMRVGNLEARLGEIQCPTLGLWGKNDNFCPHSGAAKLEKQVPGARVISIEDCGHWVMVEHPELFNKSVLEFLADG